MTVVRIFSKFSLLVINSCHSKTNETARKVISEVLAVDLKKKLQLLLTMRKRSLKFIELLFAQHLNFRYINFFEEKSWKKTEQSKTAQIFIGNRIVNNKPFYGRVNNLLILYWILVPIFRMRINLFHRNRTRIKRSHSSQWFRENHTLRSLFRIILLLLVFRLSFSFLLIFPYSWPSCV